jgi:hypothetical protein
MLFIGFDVADVSAAYTQVERHFSAEEQVGVKK